MKSKYPKGAEWRKWDLHLHTPSSHDYKNKGVTNTDILNTLEKNEISVAAITDHHNIDIERIKDLQSNDKGITIFPGIEFLSDTRGSEPIHFIGIFPENCNIDYIWGQLKNNTNIKKIAGEGKSPNEVYCDLLATVKLIKELNGICTIHAGTKHASIEKITNALKHTMAQKEDIAKNIDIYEIGKTEDQIGYIEKVFPAINNRLPMVLCSDNHNIKEYKTKDSCWIKADPTFKGLKQVLNEPEDRIFIGKKPETIERVENNRTKYINSLSIKQVKSYDETLGVWFKDVSIPFNSGLVAIIGNKGSGKSAIADILALCSNYHNDNDFSFLNSKRFREKQGRIAKNFIASLKWEDGKYFSKTLSEDVEDGEIVSLKYIPQGQFETLTNEIKTAEKFQAEIENVVFSHIPESERLGAKSFHELIEKTTNTVNNSIKKLRSEIEQTNKRIIDLEKKNIPLYKKELENQSKKKQNELDALIEPVPVTNPNEDPEKKEKNETVNEAIAKLNKEIAVIENQIIAQQKEKKSLLEAIQVLKDIKEEVKQKENEIKNYVKGKAEQLKYYEIDVDKLIRVNTDLTQISETIASKEKKLNIVKTNLGETKIVENGFKPLTMILGDKELKIKDEKAKLDSDQQQYQEYLSNVEKWKKSRKAIIGDSETIDTLRYYEAQISYLENNLQIDLNVEYEKRRKIVENIYEHKQKVITVYKNARDRLNEIIEENSATLQEYKILIDAALVKKNDFNSKFLNFINKNIGGTYYSNAGGDKHLKQIIDGIDFDSKNDVIKLLDSLIDSLRFDKRENENNAPREVLKQVKEIESLYEYLFTLDFLDNSYQLKQGEKELYQLSPGERGALLLVFYLLLDSSTIPLIIDQPEDNLDNHSVATVLVPFIKKAKRKRQIILVTHNPNLAVVADAEQIIYVCLDKEKNYTFTTVKGSIEDKEVNQKIVEVLEGAMPAFNTRKSKYYDDIPQVLTNKVQVLVT